MSEAELFELVFIAGTTAMTAFSFFITFTFAYLTVAYFIGPKLSTLEVAIVSGVYLIGAGQTFSVIMANVSAMDSFQQELSSSVVYDRIMFFMDATNYIVLAPVLCFFAVLICFYFMWSVRHTKSE